MVAGLITLSRARIVGSNVPKCCSMNGSHSGMFALMTSASRHSMVRRTRCSARRNSGVSYLDRRPPSPASVLDRSDACASPESHASGGTAEAKLPLLESPLALLSRRDDTSDVTIQEHVFIPALPYSGTDLSVTSLMSRRPRCSGALLPLRQHSLRAWSGAATGFY